MDLKLRHDGFLHWFAHNKFATSFEAPSSLPSPSQTSMMSRGTKRRAAAKEAENKIKSTLEELMGWSESKRIHLKLPCVL
jgi:hypothetical protein